MKFPVRLTTNQGQASPVQVGTVQWFSNSKGYGFIWGQDGVERFFHVTDLAGDFMPDRGMPVFFQSKQDGKGPRAVGVVLNPNFMAETNHIRRDGRVSCPHCNRLIVPRMSFWYGQPDRSFCPFCATMIQNFMGYTTLDILLDMIAHVVFFAAYIVMLVVGSYFLVAAQIDSSLGYALLGLALVGVGLYRIFSGGCRLAKEIFSGLRNPALVIVQPNQAISKRGVW